VRRIVQPTNAVEGVSLGLPTKFERINSVSVRLYVVPRVQKCDVRVDVDLKQIHWSAWSSENAIFHTFSHYELNAEEDDVIWHHCALWVTPSELRWTLQRLDPYHNNR